MVYVPNSLSMANVNVQKAPSLPKILKKTIAPVKKPEKKIIDEKTMRKMLADADEQGVDKAEIIQGILDRGYEIEDPKTTLQKIGQIGKNIGGGILAGIGSLGANVAGGIMKGVGTPMFESYQKAQGQEIKPNILQRGGEEMIKRGGQIEDIVVEKTGAEKGALTTELGKMVAPLAGTIIAGQPLGTNVAGVTALKTVSKGLKAGKVLPVLKGLAQGAGVGATEGVVYDTLDTGKPTAGSAGYGAIGQMVFTGLPIAGKVIGKVAEKTMVKPLKILSNKLYTSGLLNPKKLEYVTNALRETGDQVDNVVNRMYNRGIKGSKDDIVKKLEGEAVKSRTKVLKTIEKFTDTTKSPSIRGALIEMIDAIGDPKSQQQINKLQELQSMLQKHDNIGLTWSEVQKTKESVDDLLDIYTVAGDIKAGQKKADLSALRQEIRKSLEDRAMLEGIDIKTLNRDTSVAKKLAQGIEYKDKADWVREVLSPFASPMAGGGIGLLSGDTREERIRNGIVGAILGRVTQSTAIKTNAGFLSRKIAEKLSKMTAGEKAVIPLLLKKLDDLQATTNVPVNNAGVYTPYKSMLDTASDSIPNAKGVVRKINDIINKTTSELGK